MRINALAFPLIILFSTVCQQARACSFATPPTQVDLERIRTDQIAAAQDIVEIHVLRSSAFPDKPGRARVVRVVKGKLLKGTMLLLPGIESSMCGAGQVRAGSRGVIILTRTDTGKTIFTGFLTAAEVATLESR